MATTTKQCVIFVLIGIFCVSVISLAGCKKKSEPAEPTVPTSIETIEQKTCPVMGGAINKEFYTEYKGKNVYFCCPGCKEVFEKEPEKYLEKLPQFKK